MARSWRTLFLLGWIGLILASCAGQSPSPSGPAAPGAKGPAPASDASGGPPLEGATPDDFTVDPESLEFGRYFEEFVDNFLFIMDASGSKFLPHQQQIKLKVAKDITRRFNQKTPNRPLFGGLRRYGWEAGAFTTPTELLYGMNRYNRADFAEAIEIVRWAGGKSPMALAIGEAGDDLSLAPQDEYLALVIVSDGKILKDDPNPVLAARRVKERYGDRICIYTVAVGDDLPFDAPDAPVQRYHEKYKLLRDIAKEGQCGYMVTADNLVPDEAMETFADDVFTRRRALADRLDEGVCPDEDGDGVCDDVDKCPGTPKGAKVDENGCWILGKVQFDLNKWNIKPEYFEMLDDIARVLVLNPDVRLAVQGHTCTIWTEDYNMKLSHWRAMSVASYLIDKGAQPDQLAVEGYGFHRPFASNQTEEGRILNRRAEFKRIR